MKAKDITQIALMTAVIVILGMFPGIPLGFIPVPIVLQNMGVMLAGALLGPKRNDFSCAVFDFGSHRHAVYERRKRWNCLLYVAFCGLRDCMAVYAAFDRFG